MTRASDRRGKSSSRGRPGGWVVLFGALSSCCSNTRDAQDVASLSLACAPVSQGAHCQLLALSRDVSRSPRDVTSEASWRLSGLAGAQISTTGIIHAPEDGDLEIDAQYQSHSVHRRIRLARDGGAQMPAALRGRVYVESDGALRPVGHARVQLMGGGSSAGLSTTTLEDGSYEFAGLAQGEVLIRVTKIGYTATERSTEIHPGDNRLLLVIETASPTTVSAL